MEMDGGGFADEEEDVDGEEGIDGACRFFEDERSGWIAGGGGDRKSVV